MNLLKRIIDMLNKYDMLTFSVVMLVGAVASLVMAFIDPCETYVLFVLLFVGLLVWNISDACKLETADYLRNELADAQDKLCLAEHKADNLRVELDAAQAAVREEGLYNKHRNTPAEAPAEDKTDAPEAKGLFVEENLAVKKPKAKAYKRPAPRRKQNINVDNESKD